MPLPLPRKHEVRFMGYWFTLIYILVAYLTPTFVFGAWGQYHLEVLIVACAVIFSLPNVFQSKALRSPQAIAFAGMAFTVLASIAQTGWLGGAVASFYGFLQPSIAFFLAAANCRKKWHFKVLFLALFAASLFYIWAAWSDLHSGVFPSLYLYGSEDLRRARGLGLVNDPNDLCQVLVCLIPAAFLWRTRYKLLDVLLVGIPVLLLMSGMYLTHSRGGALALLAIVLLSARRKIGTIPAVILAALLFAGSLAVGWSGGRETSLQGGADRLQLWSAGLTMIKVHPLFGVGLGNFPNYAGITAHNSVVVCAAEIGLSGLFFWVLLLLSGLRVGVQFALDQEEPKDHQGAVLPWKVLPSAHSKAGISPSIFAVKAASPAKSVAATLVLPTSSTPFRSPYRDPMVERSSSETNDLRRTAMILVLSITGFLVAGWFLSRAISIWLFLLCGMLYGASQMAEQAGMVLVKDKPAYLLSRTLLICVGLLALVYVMVRAGH